MAKKKFKFSFRALLSLFTLILVGYVVYQNWPDIVETVNHLHETNGFVLLLMIPEQIFMYYALGQIFFSYLKNWRGIRAASKWELLRISTELNFVNHAVPAGGVGGLAFLTYRFHPYDVSAGQSSFLYIFRYAITTVINYLQAFVAMLVLFMIGGIPDGAEWIMIVAVLMNFGVFIILVMIVFVASSKRRIEFFSKTITKVVNSVVRVLTFRKVMYVLGYERINHYLMDIHESVLIARRDKRLLIQPTLWGFVYSFFEVATYWIVAIALGRPELLPVIMVGEAIGSVFDGIVPYGLYELGMAGVMIALGVDFPTATIITVMTRVITLALTIVTGIVPYYQTIRGKHD